MRSLILAFDQWMVRNAKMISLSDDPECLLRLEVQTAPRDLTFGEIVIRKGEPILAFHVWNEHLPPLPPGGEDLGWAVKTYRLFTKSLAPMADYIRANPALTGAKILRGKTALLPQPGESQRSPLASLGFTIQPYRSPLGKFGNFWEHFYLYWLIWAFNPGSVRGRGLFDTSLAELWITVPQFLARFGRG